MPFKINHLKSHILGSVKRGLNVMSLLDKTAESGPDYDQIGPDAVVQKRAYFSIQDQPIGPTPSPATAPYYCSQ